MMHTCSRNQLKTKKKALVKINNEMSVPLLCSIGSSINFFNSSMPMMYAKKVLAIRNDMAKNTIVFNPFLRIFSAFQGCLFNVCWWVASPSIQYSIFLKTISIKMVCGQAQPQNTRPKTTVKRTINTMNVSIASTNKKKSCDQKTTPNKINFRSRIFIKNSGSPFTFIKGRVKKITKKTMLSIVLRLYNLPLGFFAYIHALFPNSLMVDIESLNASLFLSLLSMSVIFGLVL